MFQVMSWIAARLASPDALIQTPHRVLAHKGFDGLQLDLDADNRAVTAAVVFEDKATSNSRDTIRDEVWPEFAQLESGAKDNLMTAEIVTLLQARPAIDPDVAIQNVIWKTARRYRVSITIGATHASDEGRERLFRGYDLIADGPSIRRRPPHCWTGRRCRSMV